MKRTELLLVSLLLAGSAVSQSNQTPPGQSHPLNTAAGPMSLPLDQKAKIEQLAKLQKDLGKMSSPGVELFLKETGRSRAEDRTLVTYSLYAAGLPPKGTYTLFQVQLDGSIIKALDGVPLDAAGQAICAGRDGTGKGE